MRLFKGFFIVLSGLFIFITILSLFIPSRLMVTRAVVINAPADTVFSQVSDLENWKHWQPVFMQDSGGIRFEAGANGISNSCEWESRGKKNKMLITGRSDNAIKASLIREGENDVQNTISILPLADSSRVQVEWSVLIKLKWYPWEKFYGIFIENITGEGYEAALNSLKTYTENN
ncbi:MAG: SRPBCC family protein [Chitinophagaceae bacterium]|nr:SRPBCC family protein [Chitinophagaceae bacterium]